MNLESVKKYLEKGEGETSSLVDGLPHRFLEPLVLNALRVDLIEPGRVVCSMNIPPRLLVRTYHSSAFFFFFFQFLSLLFFICSVFFFFTSESFDWQNSGNSLHGGATATLVDVVGSAAIPTVGYLPQRTGVSVEINVSYLDAAYVDVSIYPISICFYCFCDSGMLVMVALFTFVMLYRVAIIC